MLRTHVLDKKIEINEPETAHLVWRMRVIYLKYLEIVTLGKNWLDVGL